VEGYEVFTIGVTCIAQLQYYVYSLGSLCLFMLPCWIWVVHVLWVWNFNALGRCCGSEVRHRGYGGALLLGPRGRRLWQPEPRVGVPSLYLSVLLICHVASVCFIVRWTLAGLQLNNPYGLHIDRLPCRYIIVGRGNTTGYAARMFIEHGIQACQ
jgi:hypothetical protein